MMLILKSKKLHYKTEFQGLPISIENRKGSMRQGTDKDGHEWETKFEIPYGYIRMTEGVDGDHVDCFIGKNKDSQKVFIVHQNDPETGAFDELKVFLGFDSEKKVKEAYLNHYNNPAFLGKITEMNMTEFKKKVFKTKDNPKILKSVNMILKLN